MGAARCRPAAGIVPSPWCYVGQGDDCRRTLTETGRAGTTGVCKSSDDQGSMSGFRDDVEAMIPALRRYARALARDADIADDLVQDTLVRALRSERLFLGGDIRSWLYTILTNLNRNRRRSLARRPQFTPLLENNPD